MAYMHRLLGPKPLREPILIQFSDAYVRNLNGFNSYGL